MKTQPANKQQEKADKRAAALRENLKKRKAANSKDKTDKKKGK